MSIWRLAYLTSAALVALYVWQADAFVGGGGKSYLAAYPIPTVTPTPTTQPYPIVKVFLPVIYKASVPPTPTAPATATSIPAPTYTATSTPEASPTSAITPSATPTDLFTPTITASVTPNPTPSYTLTPSPSPTATGIATATSTYTPTQTPTQTPTNTPTWTSTVTATATGTATATSTYTPTQTPTQTPTNTPTPCDGYTQALSNPSFEASVAPWSVTGLAQRSTSYAVDGVYSMRFGNYNNANDQVAQTVVVPTWAETAAVYFSWIMFSSDSTTTQYDALIVGVFDQRGILIASGSIWNTNSRGAWYASRLVISNIAAYRGESLVLAIGGFTDSTLSTRWYVDLVWLVFACGSVIADTDGTLPAFSVASDSTLEPDA